MTPTPGESPYIIGIVFLAGVYLPIGFLLGFWFHTMAACSP